MYKQFFGLKEKPFNVTSDPSFLFLSRVHKEALSHLLYGIKERKGFLEITGEIGAGKTTLCRALLDRLDPTTKVALVLNTNLGKKELLTTILDDLDIEYQSTSKTHIISALNKFLVEQISHDMNVVLIVDEAQNLKTSVLEEIRMLSNLETAKEKLFQIVFVGQPELKAKLNSPVLTQLKQRIAVRFHITPLAKDEVADYINHRLTVAGSVGQARFHPDAVECIQAYSGGIPRIINMVCDKALLAAYVLETREITRDIMEKGIKELEGVSK